MRESISNVLKAMHQPKKTIHWQTVLKELNFSPDYEVFYSICGKSLSYVNLNAINCHMTVFHNMQGALFIRAFLFSMCEFIFTRNLELYVHICTP